MSERSCRVLDLTFAYPNQLTPLFDRITLSFGAGWTGLVGANGSGKSTFARLVTGELAPVDGTVHAPSTRYYCEQGADAPPARLAQLLESVDAAALRVKRVLGIDPAWGERWGTLSEGERKRAQIATALWVDPELLVLDEPTNHLDLEAARRVRDALRGFRGVGLLISHDRELLDTLCDRCIFLEHERVSLRPGGVSDGLAEAEREALSARRERERINEHIERLHREAVSRRELAASADARRSKRHLSPKDHDGRGRINLARVSGKDAVGGKLVRQIEQRLASAEAELAAQSVPPKSRLGVTIRGDESKRARLVHLDATELAFGDGRGLEVPELEMRPGDRIALLGTNGSGKSTLVKRVVREAVRGRLAYVPQELSPEEIGALVERFRALGPKERGALLSAVKRLGSDPVRVMESVSPSPGEARKLLLALGFVDDAELIVLDEPTNHMDLPSILCIEEALANCPASLLFVTHDARFAARLARASWRTVPDGHRPGWFVLRPDDPAP